MHRSTNMFGGFSCKLNTAPLITIQSPEYTHFLAILTKSITKDYNI